MSARVPVRILLASLAAVGCERELARAIPTPSFDCVEPDIVRAMQDASAAVEADPTSGKAWGALGDRYAAHECLAEAIACYERAESLDPDTAAWSYRLGWTRFIDRSGDPFGPMERALASVGDYYGPAHEAYAQILLREGRVDEAAEHFARSVELDPNAPQAETGLGKIAYERGDLAEARRHLEAAVARDPNHGEARILLARVLTELGLDDEARAHAEASRSLPQFSERSDRLLHPPLAPAGSTARTAFGRALERRGKLAEAAEQYRIAVESNPHAALARKRLCMLLAKEGQRAEAIALLREAEDAGASTRQTHEYLVRLLRRVDSN